LAQRPEVAKQSLAEFCATFAIQPQAVQALADLQRQADRVRQDYHLPALIITRAERGILAATPDADYIAACPPQPVVNAAGAGDCVSAALAWRLGQSDPWPEALRWAAAAGAAGVLTSGTGELRIDDVLRFIPQTEVKQI
jgi:fructose-1-phosphate kinase PfkB-like protein